MSGLQPDLTPPPARIVDYFHLLVRGWRRSFAYPLTPGTQANNESHQAHDHTTDRELGCVVRSACCADARR